MNQPVAVTRRNTVVLANLVELASMSVAKILGNDSAKSLDGIKVTRQMLADGAATHINGHLNIKLGGK